MADDGAAMAAGRLLVGQEPAAERRLHAERREEIRGHAEALHPFRLVAANQVDVPPGERRQALNPVALALPVEEIRRGHLLAAVLGIAGAVGQQKDAVHIGERERPDDQRVDHRQDGGVRAESERERQHDEAGEPRTLQVGSQRIFHVEAEGAHQGVSSRRRNRAGAFDVHAAPQCARPIAGREAKRLCAVPDGGGEPAGGGAPCVLLVEIAEDGLGPARPESGREQALGHSRRGGIRTAHDSSSPSSPPHNCSNARRAARSAASPVVVTVKYRRDRPPRSASGSPIRDLR